MEWILNMNINYSLYDALIKVGTALLLGLIISIVFNKVNRGINSLQYRFTIILLPVLIAILIYLINNNVATAFSLAGTFSLIRFRSETGTPKDILFIFFSVVIGLACGIGQIAFALIFTLMIVIVMLMINLFEKKKLMSLEIFVPENVEFTELFDEVMKKYTKKYDLKYVKTREFGSIYHLYYDILLKENISMKNFIDEIRILNSNLTVKANMNISI